MNKRLSYASQASREVMAKLASADEAKRGAAAAKNELEAFILSFRAALEDDEDMQLVTSEKQRTSFGAQLEKVEDWLYGDGEASTAAEFRRAFVSKTCAHSISHGSICRSRLGAGCVALCHTAFENA